jgi:hypothetical protein
MADAIDAGIRLTPPYGKSAQGGQMRQRDAAMRAGYSKFARHHPPSGGALAPTRWLA